MTRHWGSVNVWCAAFAVAGLLGAGLGKMPRQSTTVLIAGDIQGYLAPCGCTSPMTGGIRRLASAVATYRGPDGILLVNGGLIEAQPPHGRVGVRQNELKAQTLAEAFRAMNADAVNLGAEEATGGRGMLSELSQLSEGRTLTTSLATSPSNTVPRWIERGPLLIGGITPAATLLAVAMEETPVPVSGATKELVDESARLGKTPVLLFRGGLDAAKELATSFPALAMIVYQSSGTAPTSPITVGRTLLVTPGDHTKNLLRVEFSEGSIGEYHVYTLTPDYADEVKVSKLYRDYLRRVDKAQLIEGLVRTKGRAFAGSQSCEKCHESAYKIWKTSAHSHALKDLDVQGHARDPDCLSCHVTGLESIAGFYTTRKTPNLANVTCESCHGPAAAHAKSPRLVRLPKLTPAACMKCHESENSPNFSFQPYWAKISH